MSERRNQPAMGLAQVAAVFGRVALGIGFLSAVADRLGLWSALGVKRIAWGDFAHFVQYTATLNWFLPRILIEPLAVLVTAAEVALGIALIVGYRLYWTALASSALLLSFALAMTFALGPKAPLDYSVFAASAAALLLGALVPLLSSGESKAMAAGEPRSAVPENVS